MHLFETYGTGLIRFLCILIMPISLPLNEGKTDKAETVLRGFLEKDLKKFEEGGRKNGTC